jgi:TorA maturation chaperone TorD
MTAVLASVAVGRSVLYWLLADLFLTCPDEPLVERLLRDLPTSTAAAEHPMMRELAMLREALPHDKAGIAALADEYARLFGEGNRDDGPPLPPYESLHRNMPDNAAVGEFYAKAGLVKFDGAAPPDHLGIELRFLALLCHGESAAWRAGRAKEARGALENERDFLDQHLLAWAPAYLDMIEREARHPLYRALAGTARRIVGADRAIIDDLLAETG